jgi:hypothetical protein
VLLSLAAISHSAWSINSVFGGAEPVPMYSHDWWGWYMPGLLMSITIDVGLLAFVTRLQRGERQGSLIVGYLLLCALMAFGQFIYVASHIANFPLASGVADYYQNIANGIIKAALFVYPAALPVVSAVYAFSVRQQPPGPSESTVDELQVTENVKSFDPTQPSIPASVSMENPALLESQNVKSSEPEPTDEELTQSHETMGAILVGVVTDLVSDSSSTTEPIKTSPLEMPAKREYAIRTSQRNCAYCGAPFTPKRADHIYHTDSCRTLAYKQRQESQ